MPPAILPGDKRRNHYVFLVLPQVAETLLGDLLSLSRRVDVLDKSHTPRRVWRQRAKALPKLRQRLQIIIGRQYANVKELAGARRNGSET